MKKFKFKLMASLCTFILIWGSFLVSIRGDRPGPSRDAEGSKIDDEIKVLFMGIDSEKVNKTKNTRSDTIMIGKANKKTGKASIISVPRDTYVHIDGRDKKEKLNHAHAYGGQDLVLQTVNELLNEEIEYYVRIDYGLVKEFVDLIGGVDIYVPMDMYYEDPVADPPLKIDLKKGFQTLNGEDSIRFLRFRSGYVDQDLGRINAQQEFLKSALDKTLKLSNIKNIPKMIQTSYENIDTNIPLTVIMEYILNIAKFDLSNISFNVLPGDSKYIDKVSYYILDEEKTRELLKEAF